MRTPTVYISYRRDYFIKHTERIFEHLVKRFGKDHVLRIVDVASDEDYIETVRQKVNKSDVVLVLIDPLWFKATDSEGRWRLALENDLVRIEITTALARNIRIIPILLQGASFLKTNELPGALMPLATRNSVEIKDSDFDRDFTNLLDKINPPWRKQMLRLWPVYVGIAALLISPIVYWINSHIPISPEKALIKIKQTGVKFDVNNFIERAKANDIETVKLFIRAGIDIDSENEEDESAIKIAAANGNLELVKTLIENGADISKAMSSAASSGHKQILDFLLQRNPGQPAINQSLLAVARKGHIDIMQFLLDKGAEQNFNEGTTVLIEAIDGDYPPMEEAIEKVKLLLSKGADVNQKGEESKPSALYSSLYVAAGKFNSELVDLLISHGSEVNVRNGHDFTPLHVALLADNSWGDDEEQQRIKIIQSLIDKGADLTVKAKWNESWQPTPLLLAISGSSIKGDENKSKIALMLIDKGSDISLLTQGGVAGCFDRGCFSNFDYDNQDRASLSADNNWSVLMHAVESGLPEVVKTLISKGADVNVVSEKGNTALLLASGISKGDQILSTLLDSGAKVNTINKEGRSPLMNAAGSRYTDENIAKLLIHNGAKVNLIDKNGWTALMYAARSGRLDVTDILIKNGANIKMVNEQGHSAIDIAIEWHYKKVATLLKLHLTKH